jgi:hypothetical protein
MITSLFVGFSPIVDPMAVAGQLHTLLPNLTRVICHDCDEIGYPMLDFEEEWDRVDAYLRVFIKDEDFQQEICKLLEEDSTSS